MLATLLIEVFAAGFILMKYRKTRLQKLSIAALLLLATFQLAEYNVCGGFGVAAGTWSRIGYVAITMLPPLGLHITHALAKKPMNRLIAGSYVSGALFSGLFFFGGVFENYACTGNYVIFGLKSPIGGLFFAYYYFWLFAAVFAAMRFVRIKRTSKKRKLALINHVIGYALFMVPSSMAMLLFPETAAALPSVMCGFAVFYALTLVFAVLPHTEKEKVHVKR